MTELFAAVVAVLVTVAVNVLSGWVNIFIFLVAAVIFAGTFCLTFFDAGRLGDNYPFAEVMTKGLNVINFSIFFASTFPSNTLSTAMSQPMNS